MTDTPAELTAVDAARLLETQPQRTLLLDVREFIELETAAIEGALHIPMAEIPARLNEIDKAKTIICLCHSGWRSARVTQFLLQQGFKDVKNLVGGIDAWSRNVDHNIPRY